LLIAAYSNKVSYLVVLDLTVWLVAVAALCYLVKAPWELWFLAKAKSKALESKREKGEGVEEEAHELAQIESRMFYIAMATPFLATGGWHYLAQWVEIYGLHAMTELVHPYFVLIVGIMAGLYPVHKYYSKMKSGLNASPIAQMNYELQSMYSYVKQSQDIVERLQRQIEMEVLKNETNRVRIEQEIKSLRKEMRMFSSKKVDETQQFERRILSLENHVEFMQLMLKEDSQKGILDSLVASNPMKLLYKK